MLVCKLPLYHIIMRCLGYQQISRRLGREGCSTIRKCQLAASSFCRSLNPIFLTCISATGTGPLHSDKPPGQPQQEHCYGDPTAPSVPVPPDPRVPQAGLARSHHPMLPALPPGARWAGAAGVGRGLRSDTSRDGQTQLYNRGHAVGYQTCACTYMCMHVWGRIAKAVEPACQEEKVLPRDTPGYAVMCRGGHRKGPRV